MGAATGAGFTEDELLARAVALTAGKSRSYVEDALIFGKEFTRLLRENALLKADLKSAVDNLTAVQVVATRLLTENRELRGVKSEE